MGRRADIIADLGGATPALRRYARALCAGAGPAIADDLVQSALQSVGARIRSRELRPADLAEARIEAYAALVALAQKKLADAPGPASRHPPVVHGLASLCFDERAMLLLVSLEGFGYDASARIVGASRETALARLMRARATLGAEGLRPVASSEGARRAASHLRVVK
ncbi:RNA polymerase subunit sigma-70 [Methylocystis sp. H15]|jgi:DNA-directed RNA polymerase specialized sigma24 family protein|uniref:RNA polymerase subunit sigma-70 n=1 Tax=Methylocystis sp. H15 TaxID=2785787 RepID=UPI0018C23F32|nr:RNA polymerase subunit sigma-70 [Methylocystis sp. H15]MBG0806693.1 RNA polymerase subunit sigma-70 [Methylocystis sp. H15]